MFLKVVKLISFLNHRQGHSIIEWMKVYMISVKC